MSDIDPLNNPDLDGEDNIEEVDAMQARLNKMEAEMASLKSMQQEANDDLPDSENQQSTKDGAGEGAADTMQTDDAESADARSIYVGNVDYGATPEEIQGHFAPCGVINRVTILCDKFTGHPKGFAYVEFSEPGVVEHALALNESLFRGRLIKVTAKRTNIPGFMRGRGRGRGGYRGGGRGHRGYSPYRGRGRGGYRG